ncbi:MAG: hypothetical protein KC492_33280 [Myxococcales bacterium]|nr:hypothetical protein [Myxococcales bacterium]
MTHNRDAGARTHVRFIATALGFALLGGLLLAVALPIDAALRDAVGVSWVAHAQVHGHLQTVGFVGLFIVGMSYRLLPSFSGTLQLRFPRLVLPSFWLLAGGVLARSIGQPAAEIPLFALLMATGAWAELLGAACFAANVFPLALRALRAGQPFALFFSAGAGWFLLQAALGALWLTQLGLDAGRTLPTDRDGTLVFLQLFGFHLLFILGVALRSFPVFFAAQRPSMRKVLPPFGLLQGGITLFTGGGLLAVMRAGQSWVFTDLGALLTGIGLLWLTFFTGWWRQPTRIRPASRPFAYTLQPAMGWLSLASLLFGAVGLRGLSHGVPPTFTEIDATRHIIAIGVVLMTIVGMAQLVLPEFAGERLAGRQGAWRGAMFGGVLSLAVVARAAPRFFTGEISGDVIYWLMALAGVIAVMSLGLVAFYYGRGVRDYDGIVAAAATRIERPPPQRDW